MKYALLIYSNGGEFENLSEAEQNAVNGNSPTNTAGCWLS